MTIRDHRLKAAARDWGRAQLAAENPRRSAWLVRQAAHIQERLKARRKGKRR